MADVTPTSTSGWSKFTTALTTMDTWKKVLISFILFIAVLVGSGFAVYFKGYHDGVATCKSTKPVELKPSDKPKEKTEIYKDIKQETITVKAKKNKGKDGKPSPTICGEKMIIGAKYNGKDKIEVTAEDRCKKTTKYFDFVYQCPLVKNQIGIGPGALFTYDHSHKQFTTLLGLNVQYTRWWGNFGLGTQLGGFGALDKSMYAGNINLLLNYKW